MRQWLTGISHLFHRIILCSQLNHNTESFDKGSRDYAYGNSLPVIEKVLEDYPSIEVVIELNQQCLRTQMHIIAVCL